MQRLLTHLLYFGFLLIAAAVLISTPARSLDGRPIGFAAGAIACVAVGFWSRRLHWPQLAEQPAQRTPAHVKTLLVLVGLGVLVRLLWIVFVPPVQISDFGTYVGIAEKLLDRGIYESGGWRAYWPPGYPFFLAFCMMFSRSPLLPAVTNIGLYAGSSLLLYALGRRTLGPKAALCAVALFAAWPSHIGLTGLAATEHLFILLFLLSLFCSVRSRDDGLRWFGLAGLFNGLATLVRPIVLTFPAVWVAIELESLSLRHARRRAIGVFIAVAAMLVPVLPWTFRNYTIFDVFVPVATNGGVNLYLANNPTTNDVYSEEGLPALLAATAGDEVQTERLAYTWAKTWIANNPGRFFELMMKRQVRYLGEDSAGIYFSLKAAHNYSGPLYIPLQAVSQLWWAAIWVLAVAGVLRHRSAVYANTSLRVCMWGVLFFGGSMLPFFTQNRYHMPAVPLVLILASTAIVRPRIAASAVY